MPGPPRTLLIAATLALLACAARQDSPPRPAYPASASGQAVLGLAAQVAPICNPGTGWRPGLVSFTEISATSGLDELAVAGTRMGVADIDGDGWADLVVRRGGAREDFSPDGKRSTWLLRNQHDGTFADVTASSGLLRSSDADSSPSLGRQADNCAFADVDNDGDLDAFIAANAAGDQAAPSALLLNDGSGHFVLAAAAFAQSIASPAGVTFVDYDLDGNVDLFIADHGAGELRGQDRLYRGDGRGGFVDVTAAAGLTTQPWTDRAALNQGRAHSRAWAALACDLSGDGFPEIAVAAYGRSPNHLWQARPDHSPVDFVNRSLSSGYAFDDDRSWSDNQFARCYCAANRQAEGCGEVAAPEINCFENWHHADDRQPFRLGGNSATTVCSDIDNDGDLDLLTSEIKHWWAGAGADGSEVLVNRGGDPLTFDRPGDQALGLAIDHAPGTRWDEGHMTAAVFDFDNDAWPDIYVGASDYPGNRGRLYHQGRPLRFTEVAPLDFFLHQRSHGVAVADFDRDGDLDLVVGHSRARCGDSGECYPRATVRMFDNVLGSRGNWVQLVLAGTTSNRAAIGARVSVRAGATTQTQVIDGGHGHYGTQRDLVMHFGLGTACVAEVTIRWPDQTASVEVFTVPAGHRIYKRQGQPALVLESPRRPR